MALDRPLQPYPRALPSRVALGLAPRLPQTAVLLAGAAPGKPSRIALVVLLGMLLAASRVLAGPALHPPVPLLDEQGRSVLQSGGPVSPMQSCAGCHDTAFIAAQSTHRPADLHAAEMNCFLCHLANPDHRAMREGASRPHWAPTATLANTGLVEPTEAGWRWNREAFTDDGLAPQEALGIQKSDSTHCGVCHGLVHFAEEPMTLAEALRHPRTATTGQIFSPQRISASGINLAGKGALARPWDVHAERLLECSSCHHAANNPAYAQPLPDAQPAHLRFEARRLELDQYLLRPSHQFVHRAGDTMRNCNECHQPEKAHAWLPYLQRHLDALSCEACHIPQVAAPAYEQIDRTVLTRTREPRVRYRGLDARPEAHRLLSQQPGLPGDDAGQPRADSVAQEAGEPFALQTSLVRGYRPVLLPARQPDGSVRLVPHNIVSSWQWVAGQPERPVASEALERALFEHDQYHPDVVAALDADRDGQVSLGELALDTPEKFKAVAQRLEAVGVRQPRIQGRLRAYALHHGVAGRRWAVRECGACHSRSAHSRLTEPFELAAYVPGGAMPSLAGEGHASLAGRLTVDGQGRLIYRPSTTAAGLYVLGHDRLRWLDWLGGLTVFSALGGIAVHATLRIRNHRRRESSVL